MGLRSSKPKEKAPPKQKVEPPSTISSADRAMLQLKLQRDKLGAAIRKFDTVASREMELAAKFLKEGNRTKALCCLKKKKLQEEQIARTSVMLDNIQRMIDTIETTKMEQQIFESLREGTDLLNSLHKNLNVDDIEALMSSASDAVSESNRISEALNNQLVTFDDDELLGELLGDVPAQTDGVDEIRVPDHELQQPLPEDSEADEKAPVRVAAV